jgi:hypothetical protein
MKNQEKARTAAAITAVTNSKNLPCIPRPDLASRDSQKGSLLSAVFLSDGLTIASSPDKSGKCEDTLLSRVSAGEGTALRL